jgi:imidazoleglycerol-phosphate dehydratase
MTKQVNGVRTASRTRATSETRVEVTFNLDGTGRHAIATGIPFFNHMLAQFARHGLFDLELTCAGDLEVDCHHTVEDVAITLGQAIAEALGDRSGISRYGCAYVPMDEALVRTVVDLSGRPWLVYNVANTRESIGQFDIEMVEHFWRSLSTAIGCALHVDLLHGTNQHHITEACFKAGGRAFAAATCIDARVQGIPSTKGAL